MTTPIVPDTPAGANKTNNQEITIYGDTKRKSLILLAPREGSDSTTMRTMNFRLYTLNRDHDFSESDSRPFICTLDVIGDSLRNRGTFATMFLDGGTNFVMNTPGMTTHSHMGKKQGSDATSSPHPWQGSTRAHIENQVKMCMARESGFPCPSPWGVVSETLGERQESFWESKGWPWDVYEFTVIQTKKLNEEQFSLTTVHPGPFPTASITLNKFSEILKYPKLRLN